MKILITCALEAKTYKLINQLSGISLALADYGDMPASPATGNEFLSMGTYNPETLAHQLLSACLDVSADVCIPLSIEEIQSASISKVLFDEFNITLLVPDPEHLKDLKISQNVNSELKLIANGQDLITEVITGNPTLTGVYHMENDHFELFIARA